MYHINEVGNEYGYLTVLAYSHTEKSHAFWLCRCICGREKAINGQHLRRGQQTSCGCAGGKRRPRDISSGIDTGFKINRLEVILQVFDNNRHKLYWLCKCDCGGEKLVETYDLLHGKVKSCGCLRKETATNESYRRRLPEGISARNAVISSYKKGARSRKLQFALSNDYITQLLSSNCFYCGAEPEKVMKVSETGGLFKYNGIDRKDNSVGYVEDNVVSCCTLCNQAKRNMDYNKFIQYIDRIAAYRRR